MFRIGKVEIKNPVVAAPMAGITDQSYRILAREAGCGLLYTEMVSDQALIYGNLKTLAILGSQEEIQPVSVQIFGSNPDYLAEAAVLVEKWGAAILDLNMGCPTPKIVRNGEGSALLKDPDLAAQIVRKIKQKITIPLTAKIRLGWDQNSRNAAEIAKKLEAEGLDALAVHGRTREQFYAGQADWAEIAKVQRAVAIPVIANGDVDSDVAAKAILEQTGCPAVMIGRASQGNPWIFKQVLHYLNTGEHLPPPSMNERVEMALRHLELISSFKGIRGVWEMRKHASWYTKGLKKAARLREAVNRAGTKEEMQALLESLRESNS